MRHVVQWSDETGAVRDLLCTPCNSLLGMAKDDPKLLEKAADYLREHGK